MHKYEVGQTVKVYGRNCIYEVILIRREDVDSDNWVVRPSNTPDDSYNDNWCSSELFGPPKKKSLVKV